MAFVAHIRWPNGEQVCTKCGSVGEHYFISTTKRWKCRDCRKPFSIKVGTIFEDSRIPLSQWLPAVWMLCNCRNGVRSHELARTLGVTQKSAWFMLHRIRLALQSGGPDKVGGGVEVDIFDAGGERIPDGDAGLERTAELMGRLLKVSKSEVSKAGKRKR